MTKVVSTSNFKNDSVGIKYVEYNGTVVQIAVNSELMVDLLKLR